MADNEDLKAKMREALDRKQSHDKGVEHADHHEGKGGHSQGPKNSDKQFRRKAGG
ncbi:MAG: DUF5302 domain-containing protein [Candidatus Nanopelagicales bacterium]